MRMRKGTMLLLAIAVIASLLMIIALGGVEERSSSESAAVSQDAEEVSYPPVKLPDDFEQLSYADESILKNHDALQLARSMGNTMGTIGVRKNIGKIVFGNFTDGAAGMVVDAYVQTSLSDLIVHSTRKYPYNENDWKIISIKNAASELYYYICDDFAGTVDLYNYETDELVSKASKTFEEAASETAASVAAAEEEFDKQLDSIEEKYSAASSASAASSSGSSGFTLDVSELTFDGESIITSTEKDMREYDYIKDVTIQVDKDEIDIFVQVPSAVTEDTAKIAGEDVARYLAAQASWANDYYKQPGSDDIGSLYDRYTLMLYVDDGYKNFDLYGAKAKNANSIHWNK